MIKTRASLAFIMTESPTPMTSITGLRTSGLSPPMTAFWMTVTSVVILVTRLEVSNLSRFWNAYSWTFLNCSLRMFAPQP